MSSFIRPCGAAAPLLFFATFLCQAQAAEHPDAAPVVSSTSSIILAQVFPTTTQRPLPGAAGAVASPQAGTGAALPPSAGRPGMTTAPGGMAYQGGVNQGTVNQGGVTQAAPTQSQAGVSQTVPGQTAASQARSAQGSGHQSSGDQSSGGQASGAPATPGQTGPGQAGAAPAGQPAHPPATPASAAPASAAPVSPPAAIQPQSLGLPGGGASSGAAVVVVPEGAKRITPQVTLQSLPKPARTARSRGKTRHTDQPRSARTQGGESSGAGQ